MQFSAHQPLFQPNLEKSAVLLISVQLRDLDSWENSGIFFKTLICTGVVSIALSYIFLKNYYSQLQNVFLMIFVRNKVLAVASPSLYTGMVRYDPLQTMEKR
jgi:hypothetical protein